MFDSFKPKLVIFDLDGTLVEFPFNYLFAQTLKLLAERNLPPVPNDTLMKCFSDFDYFRFIAQDLRQDFIDYFWGNFDYDNYPSPIPLAGAQSCLKLIHQIGMKSAIATARHSPLEQVRKELEPLGFLDYLSHIAVRPSQEHPWQDKGPHIESICANLNIAPQEAMMIGDIPYDIQSARQSGIGFCVAVLSGGVRKQVLLEAEPDAVLEDVQQLTEALKELVANPEY